VEIDAGAIPPSETVNGEGMTHVVRACTDTASGRLEPSGYEQPAYSFGCGLHMERAAAVSDEERGLRARSSRRERRARFEVLLQLSTK
jgi:hypothetical protein